MEAIVITFEKRVGALERLQLAPITDISIIVGKVLGGTIFGLMISTVMTVLSILFLGSEIVDPPVFILSLLLTAIDHSALGALVAVSVKEVFEAQTLSNYFRFPMIFLCGIFLPIDEMPAALRYLARVLPLTYSVETLRASMTGLSGNAPVNLSILAGYSVSLVALSVFFFRKNQE
jgi:ABC-2 type transport system permease protein